MPFVPQRGEKSLRASSHAAATCLVESRFLQHTTRSMREMAEYLDTQRLVMNKGTFGTLETRVGFNYSPEGVLACKQLTDNMDLASAVCYDYMHIYLVSGLFHHEINLMMDRLAKVRIKGDFFHSEMQRWTWPNFIGSKAAGAQYIFETKKNKQDTDVKRSASEALSAYPVLRMLVNDLLQSRPDFPSDVKESLKCFLSLCAVLDQLTLSAREDGSRHANTLRRAIQVHLRGFLSVYGEDSFLPKAHMALHLPSMLEHHHFLIACFVHERRHKELKRFGNNQANTAAGTEKHLMKKMLLSHLDELLLSDMVTPPGLCNGKPAAREVLQQFQQHCGLPFCSELLASSKAFYAPNRWASTGDVVILREQGGVAEVVYHCEYEEMLLTCVLPYGPGHGAKNTFSINRTDFTFIRSSDIQSTCIFREQDGVCTIAPQLADA